MICIQCQAETNNPKFCSRSCAASYNGAVKPKRKLTTKYCKHCNNELKRDNHTDRRKVCDNCKPSIYDNKTIADVMYDVNKDAYNLIRTRARLILEKASPKICKVCGYSKHVEACHIKSISSFDKSTKILVVNDLTNLIYLCPNCHWEYDHDLLDLAPALGF